MKSRQPLGYVVEIDGPEITLNLLDIHRGQVAAHLQGVSPVTEVGSLLAIDAGSRVLVMKVLSLSFAEPKEAYRLGVGGSSHQTEPLRNVQGIIVGRLVRKKDELSFVSDSLPTPPLGAEAFPLTGAEMAASLGSPAPESLPISLGEDLRGGGILKLGLESLISRHVAVLGSSGQGKSCFTAAVLQQIVRFPQARIVIFDINDEYQDAFDLEGLPEGAVERTTLGGQETNSLRIPYYALGRSGLNRLLVPSEKTQRPALTFALENLRHVKWFEGDRGAGLGDSPRAILFDDCRSNGAVEADGALRRLREGGHLPPVGEWPPMMALAALVAESHSLQQKNNSIVRDSFLYGNVSPLITRINRFVDDPMFTDVVSVDGGPSTGGQLN
jgi:hypothetical protein